MKKKIGVICIVVGAMLCGIIAVTATPYTDAIARIGQHTVLLEHRTTPKQWQQGLSGREGLCRYCGMLFLFPTSEPRRFWMKDMNFNIDILWLLDQKVIHIESDVSFDTPEKTYGPDGVANMVLELPAKTAHENNIVIGTELEVVLSR